MQVKDSTFVQCSFVKIFITSAIFQALRRSFTYIVSLVINSEHSSETSIIRRLDFFFPLFRDFHFLELFFKSAPLSRMQFCAVSGLLLTVTKAYFQLAALF